MCPPIEEFPDTGPASMRALKAWAAECRACGLWRDATQTVTGEGPRSARLMLVGEQPGDKEDLAGKPFVGPAGRMLDRALASAGINRKEAYVTNAVKHFKHEQRGKRRLHKRPNTDEIQICRWWLDKELKLIRPRGILAMGATAARSLLHRTVTISNIRGTARPYEHVDFDCLIMVTVHPSALLRIREADAREAAFNRLVEDLSNLSTAAE